MSMCTIYLNFICIYKISVIPPNQYSLEYNIAKGSKHTGVLKKPGSLFLRVGEKKGVNTLYRHYLMTSTNATFSRIRSLYLLSGRMRNS